MAEEEPASSPRRPHPTAQAFFTALDTRKRNDGEEGSQKQSEFVRKRLSTLGWRSRHSQDEYYPVTVNNKTFSVLQIQRGEIEGTYGTGACVWPAAVVLLKYLERHAKALVSGKNVVDLGSGTSITSVAAALLGAKHVICTDGSDQVVQLAKDNIAHAAKELEATTTTTTTTSDDKATDDISIEGCKLDTQVLWWGKDALQYFGAAQTDLVLVADCVLPKLYPIAPLVQAMDELLIQPNALAIVSYEHRYYPEYDPRDKFRECANARGLVMEVVPMSEHDAIYSVDDIEIWKVYRRKQE